MGLLRIDRKIKASSLVETLVSTVLLMLVFGMVLMLVHSVVQSRITFSSFRLEQELQKQLYLYQHAQLSMPYNSIQDGISIQIKEIKDHSDNSLVFIIRDLQTNQEKTMQWRTIQGN